MFYQPILNVEDHTCVLCEGLLRWRHPKRGLLNAADFIPAVELTEHISFLTYRVIELAVQDIAKWRDHGREIKIAINLSARNFLDPRLATFLIDTAEAYGVSPNWLQLEITETLLMKDPDVAAAITQRLHDAGFNLVLDDFGTGYSSLAYLGRFPISGVKIDRSFIEQMTSDERSKDIVAATIDLTHKLGFTVTAEGVESQEAEALLARLGCDYLQGYRYLKPVERAAFDSWYIEHTGNNV